MKSIFIVCLLIVCSFQNIQATVQTGPDFQDLFKSLELIGNLKDISIMEDLEGNFFGNLWSFLEGFFNAVEFQTVVTSETDCVQSTHKFISTVELAVNDFLDGKIAQALIQFNKFPTLYNKTVYFCNNTFVEVGRYFQQLQFNIDNALNTGSGVKNLVKNLKEVHQEFNNGKTAWKNGDFYSSGNSFGQILEIFLFGKPSIEEEKKQEEVIVLQTQQPVSEHSFGYIQGSPLIDNIVNHLVQAPQGKNMIEGILNFASSYMGPALNVYDTDDLN